MSDPEAKRDFDDAVDIDPAIKSAMYEMDLKKAGLGVILAEKKLEINKKFWKSWGRIGCCYIGVTSFFLFITPLIPLKETSSKGAELCGAGGSLLLFIIFPISWIMMQWKKVRV